MRELILIHVLLLAILTADQSGALAIVCHCEKQGPLVLADCTEPLVCSECYSEIFRYDGEVSRRWGCVPAESPHFCEAYLDVYNVTCCNDSNFCNRELYPSLSGNPPVTTTSTPTSEPTVMQPSEPTTNTETAQATLPSSNSTSPATQPATTSPLPIVPTSSRTCLWSSSSSPEILICSLQRTCYVTSRRDTDNRVTFRRGCSSLNRPCVPENRKRKIKICCNSSLCNNLIPTFGEAPELDPGPGNNTTNVDRNKPVSIGPDISIDPPSGPNASDINTSPTDTTTDQSTQAVTAETTPVTVPPETPPPTNNLPERYHCVCDTCEDGKCQSTMGCATKHEEDDGVLKVTRMCIENSAICAYSQAADFYVDCCKGELCNHVNSSITPRPATFSPTTDVDQTVPTSSVPPSDETGGSSDASTKGLSVYYVLTIFVGVIFLVIAVVLIIICIYVCQRHQLNLEEIRKKNEQRQRTAALSIRTGTLA